MLRWLSARAHLGDLAYDANVNCVQAPAHVRLPPFPPSSRLPPYSRAHRDTGWRVRVLTYDGPSEYPGQTQVRSAWRPDQRTVLLQFDPTSPNIIAIPYM